ncbi:hypothetical protein COU37_00475 [Candidatus Micrarchaeota archaeon CG10_big_fil_rev_8_21_14_0_10_45_29]|nr:MAG: hypothetical protein COU37_00475 [Candidatus Micrarchaeota archaeon CG10_big_fil_rev_8_21_14_0_10_45_29]
MQTHIHKKEKSPTIKCPKCGASNLTSQKSCGKCGFRFERRGGEANKGKMPFGSVSGARGVGEEQGKFSNNEGRAGFAGGENSHGGGYGAGFSGMGENMQGMPAHGGGAGNADSGEGVDAGKEETHKVPDKFAKNGQSEGLLKSRKQWVQCPVCNSDIRPDAKRCPRCGHKN